MSMSLVSFLYRSDLQYVNWFVLSSSSSKNLSAKLFLSGLHSCSFNPYQILRKKMKFSIRDFVSKCDQIRRKLRIWSHLLKKSLMENFIFCAVRGVSLLFLNILWSFLHSCIQLLNIYDRAFSIVLFRCLLFLQKKLHHKRLLGS